MKARCAQCRMPLATADARCPRCHAGLRSLPAGVRIALIAVLLVTALAGGAYVILRFFTTSSSFVRDPRMRTERNVAPKSPSARDLPLSDLGPIDKRDLLALAFHDYADVHGFRPPALLQELLDGKTAEGRPFLDDPAALLDDHGRPWLYEVEEEAAQRVVRLTSLGQDGAPGGTGPDADRVMLTLPFARR